jgi:serum/glucocorticoid-regulated kinase 2
MGKKLSKPDGEEETPTANTSVAEGNINPNAVAPRPMSSTDKKTGTGDYSDFTAKITVEDFDLLKVLGKGSFGKVMLVKKKDDPKGTLFAMKTLRKTALAKRNQLAHTSTERLILQTIQSPFLVHLEYAFQTPDKLYMVLDYMGGGELFFWLKKDKKFSEVRARLYAAEIACGIAALHAADIVYRDLKPENLLLGLNGHLKLTDFGLTKPNITGPGADGGTKTFCGTPEYLAPEILENKGHGKAVDWWALGTLLFEMLTGLPPFYDTNVQRMYHKILHEPLRFPKSENRQVGDAAKETLRGLLERMVSSRLGSGMTDVDELKRSAFFRTLDFGAVMRLEYEPEFKPPAQKSETDVSNFDEEFTKEVAKDSVVTTHMSETMQEKTNFEGFTFQGDNAMK